MLQPPDHEGRRPGPSREGRCQQGGRAARLRASRGIKKVYQGYQVTQSEGVGGGRGVGGGNREEECGTDWLQAAAEWYPATMRQPWTCCLKSHASDFDCRIVEIRRVRGGRARRRAELRDAWRLSPDSLEAASVPTSPSRPSQFLPTPGQMSPRSKWVTRVPGAAVFQRLHACSFQ